MTSLHGKLKNLLNALTACFYQLRTTEAREEGRLEGELQGKLESVPGFLELGLTVEQIASALKLEIAIVRQAAQNQEAIATSKAQGTEI